MSLAIQSNKNLTQLNSFRLKASTKMFFELTQEQSLYQLSQYLNTHNSDYFILGGGSNLILPEFYNGLVIHNRLSGIKLVSQDDQYLFVEVMAGENWDNFVGYSLANAWYGLENLSLIPGTVGATPIQNIGAYGVEVKDFIQAVRVFNLHRNTFEWLSNHECEFSYRNSIFKTRRELVVVSVKFKLLKHPQININYADIKNCLGNKTQVTPSQARDCVIKIRQTKLPDPNQIGNVGSFFHNPIISKNQASQLLLSHPNLPVYNLDHNHVKISAGWLIDNLQLKGYQLGNVGVYDQHALVLVNLGGATQVELLALSKYIQDTVQEHYGIMLHIEPIVVIPILQNKDTLS